MRGNRSARDTRTYFLFVLPSILLFIFAIGYPFVSGINIAFTDWDGISKTYNYVGFKNFAKVFSDSSIIKPIRNTLVFAVGYTTLNNVLALTLAVFLMKKMVGKNLVKTIFFIPMALSQVLAAFVWSFIDKQIISELLGTRSLLGNPKTVILGIIIIALWNQVGSNLMIYIAGLTNISSEYYEAAKIDGAGEWQTFRYVMVPLLGPSFTMCIVLTLTTALREFGTVMAATGGGPAKASETISIFIYQNLYSYQKAGYGQAVAIVFMVILVAVGTGLNRFFRNREVETQ
ncbi:MAG: sugar ABC transporter permease [Eubacteriales bacterium]|nr:sugar ABC transporter permease [Eubacteriales bacterium]